MKNKSWQPLKLDCQPHNAPGKLIVFDGVDGSGKTSIISELSQYLNKHKKSHILTKTPSDDVRNMRAWRAWSNNTFKMIEDEIYNYGLSMIALGDRLVHQVEIIEPALRSGDFILCDRYILTNIVYESSLVHKELSKMLFRPDLGIITDVEPQEALKRIRQRENDEHPKDAIDIPKLVERYRTLAQLNNYLVVNTTNRQVEDSLTQIVPKIEIMLADYEKTN